MPQSTQPTSVIDQLLDRASSLYTLPTVAVEVLRLSANPNIDAAALGEVIESDPALVGKLLRTVNSSLFGLGQPVASLNQAVALLGVKPLKLLVLGFSLPTKMFQGIEAELLADYWGRSLIKAVAARRIAEVGPLGPTGPAARANLDPNHNPPQVQADLRVDGDEAFLAGLLQDIGVLVLLQDLGDAYTKFVNQVKIEHGDLLRLELSTLGFDHRILSARLLAKWGLPEAMTQAVGANEESPSEALPRILQLAEWLAQLLIDGRAAMLVELLAAGDRDGWWTPEELDKLVAQLQVGVDQLSDVLDVKLGGEDYAQIVADAHAQLAAATEDLVGPVCPTGPASRTEPVSAAANEFAAALISPNQVATIDEPQVQSGRLDLPADAHWERHIAAAVAEARRRRLPLSLLIAEVDEFADQVFLHGPQLAAQSFMAATALAQSLCDSPAQPLVVGEARFALPLADCERAKAVDLARRLNERLATRPAEGGPADVAATLSIGIATVDTPAINFPAADLIEAAERCLAGVQTSGGAGVKSIDIY